MYERISETAGHLRIFVVGISAAAWIAIATFFGLMVLTALAWLIAWNNPIWVPWGTYLTLTRGGSLLGAALIACGAEYLLFRIWFNETPLPNRELQAGWTAGLRHLRRDGMRIQSLPCFLLLDPTGACESWFDAAGLRMQRPETAPDSPVRWYPAKNSLFLVIQGLGCLGPLTKELNEVRRRPCRSAMLKPALQSMAQPAGVAAGDHDLATIASGVRHQDLEAPGAGFGSIDVHAVRDALQYSPRRSEPGGSQCFATIDESMGNQVSGLHLSSTEISRRSRELAEVCRRLVAYRRPVVPVNGICVLFPERLLSALTGGGARLGQALRHDLDLLQKELGVIAPVSLVMTGVEEDAGMVELIRRVGRDHVHSSRLGWGTGPCRATQERLRGVCEELMVALQSFVGRRLRDPLSVGRPGAHRLYRLMSSLRGDRSEELQSLITQAFSTEGAHEPDLLTEVTLSATGQHPTERAFAGSTYRQMIENQEFVEWTVASGCRERRFRWLATTCGALSIAAASVLVALLLGVV